MCDCSVKGTIAVMQVGGDSKQRDIRENIHRWKNGTHFGQ